MREKKLRTQSCRMKNHYTSLTFAEEARLRQQEEHGWLLVSYLCDQCGEYHHARRRVQGKPIPIVGGFKSHGTPFPPVTTKRHP